MKRQDVYWVAKLFIVWRASLFLFSYLGIRYFSLQENFLGGGIGSYLANPLLWSFGNFDGLNYLLIAQNAYNSLLYFYFPLYPFMTNFLSPGTATRELFVTGLAISHVSFFAALLGLWKLLKLDYETKLVKKIIILIVLFPTSFYFAAFYTESIFLALVVWSFYFVRTKKFFLSGITSMFTSATRIVGLALFPAFMTEYFWDQRKTKSANLPNRLLNIVLFGFSGLGFLAYLIYLQNKTGDFLAFNKGSELFGEYRSQTLLVLPQIFYRYIIKIIPSLTFSYFPVVFTTLLEFAAGTLGTVAILFGFSSLRKSYWVYMIIGFLMPSFYNGFVSMPRYILVLFPVFIFLALFMQNLGRKTQILMYSVSYLSLGIATALFTRGYWIS